MWLLLWARFGLLLALAVAVGLLVWAAMRMED